jgi:predicted Zn-dependent peptidase
MKDPITASTLDCGMTLVVEPIENVRSVALHWLLPLGAATDPPEGDGQAALLSELIFRGAGGLGSRQHSDAFDRVGVRRSSDVGTYHLRLHATLLGQRLSEALPLIAAMVREPAMPEDALDPVRNLCLQSLDGLHDDPQHLVMLRVRERHVPPPFGRHGYGQREVLEREAIEGLRAAWGSRCTPRGSILGVAGAVDALALARTLNELLRGWTGEHADPVELSTAERGTVHVPQETAQVHLAVAYDAPAEGEETSMLERLATRVLSGGTSGRLYTEVRQKRSLCYSVGASYRGGKNRGMVSLYAGTTPDRAQQTLDVCLGEIERLREGAAADELARAATRLKAHLIMSGESTGSRAAAIAHDRFRLGRARTLEDIAAQVDAVTLDDLNAYLRDRDFGEFTIASIGPHDVSGAGRHVSGRSA